MAFPLKGLITNEGVDGGLGGSVSDELPTDRDRICCALLEVHLKALSGEVDLLADFINEYRICQSASEFAALLRTETPLACGDCDDCHACPYVQIYNARHMSTVIVMRRRDLVVKGTERACRVWLEIG